MYDKVANDESSKYAFLIVYAMHFSCILEAFWIINYGIHFVINAIKVYVLSVVSFLFVLFF